MFSFQGASLSLLRDSMKSQPQSGFQSISWKWWRLAGSNRWPPACKAGALPAELNPHIFSFWSGGPKWTRFLRKATPVSTVHWTVSGTGFESILRTLTFVLRFRPFSVFTWFEVVGQNGLEPSTSRLSVVCSSQLSYWPVSDFFWWRVPGSNRWPPACKAGALPAELTPRSGFLSF